MRYLIVRRDDYLAHHGVKGQKWGVRRYQNPDGSLTPAGKKRYGTVENFKRQTASYKEIKNFKTNTMNREEQKENSKIKSQKLELEKKAYALAKKYDFDGDDGGGGSTKESRKAGREYMKIWEKIEKLENDAYFNAQDNTTKALIDKYGNERMDRFYNQQGRRVAGAAIGFVGALLATPIALGAIGGALKRG